MDGILATTKIAEGLSIKPTSIYLTIRLQYSLRKVIKNDSRAFSLWKIRLSFI
jgi:hypothetical protein